MELDTDQISKLLSKDRNLNFLGVYPLDKIPKHINTAKPVCLIFNSDKSSQKGEHWISMVFTGRDCVYLDPLGVAPFDPVVGIIRRHSDRCIFNKDLIQNPVGSMCGYYAMYFCKKTTVANPRLREILAPFRKRDLVANDRYVMNWVMQYAKKI